MSKASKRRDAIYNIIQNQIDEILPARDVFDCEAVAELAKLQVSMCGTFYQANRCTALNEKMDELEAVEEEA